MPLIFTLYCSRSKKNFERTYPQNFSLNGKKFRIDERLQKIFFKKGNEETWLEEIPSIHGCPFSIDGKKSFTIIPRLSGAVGFYTYLYFDNLQKENKIQFTVEIHRAGKNLPVRRIARQNFSQRYFQDLTLQKNDKLILKFAGYGIAFFSEPIIYKKKPLHERKNIFLIAVDTLRWDQVGARKGDVNLTPNIAKFKKDCLAFENAYAQSSWTLPSFMSLFTGLYEFNHKVDIKRPLEPGIPSLVEKLSGKFITFGYHSGMSMRSRWGHSRGFDYYNFLPFTTTLFPKAGQTLFRQAAALLEQANFPDFFFFLHTYQVHDPYTPPREFLLKLNGDPVHKKLDVVNQNAPWKTFQPVDEDLKKALKELYQAEIHAFDSYFGKFIEKLKDLEIYDGAMIILLSDHGEEFYEHNGWAHSHSLYNELIKVPLLVKFPGGEFEDAQLTEAVGLIDLFPTILSYYRVEYDKTRVDGVDLMPIIRGKKQAPRREFLISSISESRYIQEIPPKIALLQGDYKIIYSEPFSAKELEYFKPAGLPPLTPQIEVFDLKNDPGERSRISTPPAGLLKQAIPFILEIKKKIKRNISDKQKKETDLDEEARKQLESLGYIEPPASKRAP